MKKTLRQIKTYIKSHTWLQYSLIWIGLLIISALGLNDNYHTLSWLNRIFPPFKHEDMTFFTGTIILIIVIYNLFRAFYYTTGNYLFNKGWKCFICTLIFVNLLSGINAPVIQKIRGLQSGLNAIYLDRNKMFGINLYDISVGKEKMYRSEGSIRLKNCSDETVGPFKITVTLAQDENHPSGSFTCDYPYELAPKEQKYIHLNYEGPLTDLVENSVYDYDKAYIISDGLQIMLWDENQQVTFYSE